MATVELDHIIGRLDELLDCSAFDDYGPNGLQVPGPSKVGHVVTGVSASVELFERAAEIGANLVIVHHGLFWGRPMGVDAALNKRLKLLYAHDMALAAYHLPLDAHPKLGNNALIADRLGCVSHEPFEVGVAALFEGDGISPQELVTRVASGTAREPLAFLSGPNRVRSVAIVSGAAAGLFDAAVARGLDAFITGEPAERVMAQAAEAGIHFLAAGHYATETFGVRAVGDLLEREVGVRHTFIDVPNPI